MRWMWLQRIANQLGYRKNRRRNQTAPNRLRQRLNVELLEDRVNPSPNIMAGGIIHLPFNATEVEGTATATLWTGNPAANPTILDFTDPNGTTSDYSVTVSWGDGSLPQTFLSTNLNAPLLVTGAAGGGLDNFHVVPTSTLANAHIYDEAPVGNLISVTVTDVASGASTGPVSTNFTPPLFVQDAILTDTTPASGLTSPIDGTEGGTIGIPLAPVTIATFSDDNPNAVGSDFTVAPGSIVVDWAGALQPAAPAPAYTVVETSSNGLQSFWEVQASGLVFAEPGTYSPNVTVNDDGGQSVAIPSAETPRFVIGDAPLTDTTPINNTVPAVEGNSFSVTLMTFDDANPYAPQSDFSVPLVTYTNGPVFLAGPSYSVVANGAPSGGFSHWAVVATATIAEEGDYTATVNVLDVDGSNASTSNTTIDVADAALTAGPLTVPSGLSEGNTISDQPIFTFTDANPFAPATDYTATVTPGDGTGPLTITSTAGPNGVIVFNGTAWEVDFTHTYVEEVNAQPFSVVVNDVDGDSTGTVSGTITVTDPAVVLGNSTITLPTINEGSSTGTVVVGTFTDPGGAEVPLEGPGIAHWFPGEGNANDTTGGTTGTINGAVTFAAGQVGQAFSFLGNGGSPASSPSVSYPASDFAPGTSDFSVAFGLQTTYDPAFGSPEVVLGDRSDSSNGNFFCVRVTNGGFLDVEIDEDGGGTNFVAVNSTAPINDGLFHDIVITRSGTTLSLYIDGAFVESANSAGVTNLTANGGANAFQLGAEQGAASFFTVPLTGLIDEVQTYSQALTPAQISTINSAFQAGGYPDYSATIAWGDGTTSAGDIVYDVGAGVFDVYGSHTYADESTNNDAGPAGPGAGNYGGVFNIATTVVHDTSAPTPTAVTAAIEVDDVQITTPVISTLPTDGQEGQPVAGGATIATFTDPAGLGDETSASFTATIFWGDGSNSTGTVVYVGDGTNGDWEVNAPAGGHTYIEEGTYPITVTVQHDAEPALTSVPVDIGINDPAVIVTGVAGLTPVEGQSFTGPVATFTDPGDPTGTVEALTDYAATITWGDGSTSAGTISGPVMVAGVPTYTVTGTHTYAEESGPEHPGSTPYTIAVNVSHEDAVYSFDGTNVIPVTATLTSPGNNLPLPSSDFPFPAQTPFGFSANFSTTTGGVILGQQDGTSPFNTPPTGWVPAIYVDTNGDLEVEMFFNAGQIVGNVDVDDGLTHNITVVYDGTTETAYLDGVAFGSEALTQTPYAGTYSYQLGTGFTNGWQNTTGGWDSFTGQISSPTFAAIDAATVADPPVVIGATPITLPTINEGQSVTNAVVATFTDPGGSEAGSDYNATISWGDGTSSPGTIVGPVAGINVSIFNNISASPSGAPYSGFIGSFTSPDIQFGTPDSSDNWAPLSVVPGNAFGADVTGNLLVSAGGNYTFSLDSDDGSQLYIDGNLIIDNGGSHSPVTLNGTVNLTAGVHSFEIQYENTGGGSELALDLPGGVSFAATFDVIGSHTYAEESTNNDAGAGDIGGVYQISTTVQHELSSPTPTAVTATIQVNDLPVSVTNSATNISYADFGHGPNTDQLALNGSTETQDSWAQQEFDFLGFSAPPPFYAQPVGNVLQLTDGFDGVFGYLGFGGGEGEAGSAFFPTPISTTESFTTQFQFDLHGGTPPPEGEGITFTIAGDPFELGNVGTDLGYGGNEAGGLGNGIFNSEAVGFQLASNTVDVFQDGVVTPDMPTNPGFSLFGAPVNVWLDYNYDAADPAASTLAVYVSQGSTQPAAPLFSATVELDTVVGAGSAFVGFTGGSDATAVQEIRSWQLTSPVVNATEGQAIPSETLATFTDPGNIVPAGQVLAVNIGNGGAGYTAPTVTFSDPSSPGASGATGTVDFYNGVVTGVTILTPGSGYDANTVAVINDPTGVGASGAGVVSALEPPSDYTVLVNWGAPGDTFVSDPNVTVSAGDPITGVYTITGTHAYAEEGDYTLQIEVNHEGTGIQTITEPVVVADVPLTNVTSAGPTTVTEGSAAPILIGTFTDAGNPNGLPEVYSADINFGDGGGLQTNYPITVTEVGNTDVYDVFASHVYAYAPGGYTLTATIHHENTADAAGQPISDAITVNDPVLVATAGASISGVEGSATNLVTLATFSDAGNPTGGTENPVSDYLATVTWGDGHTSTSADGDGDVVIVAVGNGNYVVEGTHVYADESAAGVPYTVTTTIQETDNAATLSNAVTESATISDPAVAGTGGFTVTAVEGSASTTQTVATFTDPGGPEAAGNYTATINWGDGTSSAGTVASPAQSISTLGSWDGSNEVHSFGYPNTATYGQTITATGSTLSSFSFEMDLPASTTFQGEVYAWNGSEATGPALFQSAAMNTAGAGLQQITFNTGGISVTPGSQYVIFATVSNESGSGTGGWGLTGNVYAGGGFVYINNGSDTSQWTTVPWDSFGGQDLAFTANFAASSYTVTGSHTYAEDGNYTVSTVIAHGTAPATTVISTATVSDPAVIPSAAGAFVSFEGLPSPVQPVATFTDPGTPLGESLNEYAATINWGDGTQPTTGTIVNNGGVFTVYGAHTYASVGNYSISVTIDHGSAPASSTTTAASVGNPSAHALGGFTITGTEGIAGTTAQTVAIFVDPGDDTNPANFSATINWGAPGDTPVPVPAGAITYNAGYFTIAVIPPAYVEEGTYSVANGDPITVVISHGAAPTVSVHDIAVIADAQITTPVDANLPAAGLEGASIGPITAIATFTDPAGVGSETPADFPATINWGDGTTSPGTVVSLGGGNYEVNAPIHTYVEEGAYTETVTVTHDLLPALTSSGQTIVVADQQIINLVDAHLPANGLEGVGIGAITAIATFTDPAGVGNETPADFTATVHWGDGTSGPGTIVSLGGGNYEVNAGNHTYVEEGAYTETVTVTHDHLAPVTSAGQTITIADQQITNLVDANLPATGLEGASFGPILSIATFTDPAGVGDETTADFTATINWGDMTTSAGQVVSLGGGNYAVNAPAHTYVEEGSYTETVTVKHDALAPVTSAGQTIVVADQQLADLTSSNLPPSLLENTSTGPIVAIARFLDPAGAEADGVAAYTATINWGDTTTSPGTIVSLGGGEFEVNAPAHIYVEEGTYTVNVTLKHDLLPAVTTPNQTIVVADQQLTNLASANLPAAGVEGASIGAVTGIASFTDPAGVGDETIADFKATINWGDGTTSSGTIVAGTLGNYTVNAPAHTYAEEGAYSVTVTLTHDLLSPLTTPAQTIVVSDPSVVLNVALLPFASKEGQPSSVQTVATFTDPGGAETVGDYNAVVSWGDTTSSAGFITFSGGVFSVLAAHTYAEEGSYSISVTVSHDTSVPSSGTTATATVSDPSVVLNATPLTVTGLEGAATGSVPVATFTDPAGPELTSGNPTPGEYSADVSWGDGNTDLGITTITWSRASQTFTVLDSHTYGEEGSYTITVTLHHGTSAAVTAVTAEATIADQQLTNLASANLPVAGLENASIGAITGIATFTDPAGAEADGIAAYTATINWGDGATSPGTIVAVSGGNFSVNAPAHTYVEEGTYIVTVTLTHDLLPALTTPSQTIVVADQQITTPVDANLPATGLENAAIGAITGIATFTDPAGVGAETTADFAATVHWGDGTSGPGTIVSLGGGAYEVNAGNHTYVEEGTYTETVTVTHDRLAPLTSGGQIIVIADQQITTPVDANLPANGVEGANLGVILGIATFTDPAGVGNETTADFTATINWGDTTASVGQVVSLGGGKYAVNAPAHTYVEEGTYIETVTVKHDALTAVTSAGQTIVVADPAVVLNTAPLSFSAVEGSLSATQTVATFTDPGGAEVHQVGAAFVPNTGEYLADISWGDGSLATINATIMYNFVTQTFSVMGQHDYTEEGTDPISVTVFHDAIVGAGVSSQTANATVSDPSVIGAAGPGFNAVEGTLSAAQTLATFTDPGDPTGTIETLSSDYSASVNWGDGTAIGTRTEANGGITVSAGTFTVTGKHDYAEEGAYQITIVLHHDLAPDVTLTETATVTDPSVTLNAVPIVINAVEGQQISQNVATFTDPGGAEPVGEYSASIAWGDGNTTPGLVTQTGANSYQVSLFHTYAEEGSYNVTVTVSHGTSTPASGVTATVTVSDPSVLASGGLTLAGIEGAALVGGETLTTFTDPAGAELTGGAPAAGEYSATVNLGSGAVALPAGDITYNGGSGQFVVTLDAATAASNVFTEEGSYPVSVVISHGTSNPTTVTDTAVISDPAVVVTGNLAITAQRGFAVPVQTVATFTDPGGAEVTGTTPNAGEYSATVSWGDATPTTPGAITFSAGTFTVSAGGHIYTQNGNYTITVQVSHPAANGSTVTVSSFVSVVDPSVILSSVSNITSLVGTPIKNVTVATFTDPAGAQVISGFPVSGAYTAYINWGDGTIGNPDLTIGAITYSTVTGAFTVKGSHTYTEDSTQPNSGQADGMFDIIVTVAHGNSVPATGNTTDATITNPPVLANGNKTVSGVEGSAPASPWLLATFTDPGAPGGTGSGYAATITWGDTTSSAGSIAFDTASGKWDVTGSHAYSSFGTYTIQVTITHDSTPVTVHDTAKIADAPLAAGTLTVPAAPMNVEAPAGSTAAAPQVLFTFTDANTSESGTNFTATVSWGDSLTNTSADHTGAVSVVSLGGGAFEVKGTHVYTEELNHATFSVSVKDAGGAKTSASGSLVVTDPSVVFNATPLTFLSVVNVLSDIQPVATFTDPGGPEVIGGVPKAGEYSALINWGDGTAESNGVITYSGGTFTVSGAHRYGTQANATYQISVTVAHGSAAPATAVTATTTVSAAKHNQTITFPTPTGSYAPSPAVQTVTIPLAASATSGLPITYTVHSITLVAGTGTGSITSATVSGHTLTLKIAANTTANFSIVLYANQPGDLNYNPAAQVAATLTLTNSRRGSGG